MKEGMVATNKIKASHGLKRTNSAANDSRSGKIGARAKPVSIVPRVMVASECPPRTRIRAHNPAVTDAI